MLSSESSNPPPDPNPSSSTKYSQEAKYINITQEYKALISTLPKHQGWAIVDFYQYQGFWRPDKQIQAALTCKKHFQARDTDFLLITSPKSGTTWLKALMYSILHRAKWAPLDVDHPLLTSSPHDLIPFLEVNVCVDPNHVPDVTLLPPPRVFATHLPIESLPESVIQTGCKIVYLCRNPRDTFISMWHFANNLGTLFKGNVTLEEAFESFCNGVSPSGPFWEHILGYWKYSLDNPQKVFFSKFEDLKQQPVLYLKRLADFCECPFTKEEENQGLVEDILKLCSFDNLSNLEVNKSDKLPTGAEKKAFFRKGEVGDWTNYFSPEMTQRLDKICEEKFHPWGLRF